MTTTTAATTSRTRTAWWAVLTMMATSFTLVTAEFLPPSLLPSMASSLGITEGQAGQAVTATAFVGLFIAPTIAVLFPRLDRRSLLVGLTVSAAVSNAIVAVAPNLLTLLAARLLLGAAIGGFWAMSLAVAARLSAPQHLGRAVMLVNTGTTLATVAGVPLGIFLGSVFDWRNVFAGTAVLSVGVAIALRFALPPVAPGAATGFRGLGSALQEPGITHGLIGHVLVVLGHFAAFTYVRSALEQSPSVDSTDAAALLVVFGVGGFVGNLVVGAVVDLRLHTLRLLVPLSISAGIGGIAAFPGEFVALTVAVTVWGFGFGAWLTVVSTWMARVASERMEAGGGLVVAGFQLAITLGAGAGGVVVDALGIRSALVIAAAVALAGAAIFSTARPAPVPDALAA
ncbi:MFS transporter [Rhodococcoides fascians]|uniref:MFS transporter n=1 Tax=Rhodococcoides fascians TaxID=1828 RepID=UPI00050C4CD9|nr:MFS transporter [Rhodococcus fascians]